MDLTPYTQKLRDDLLTAASIGDEASRRAAAMLAGALEPAARLAIMDALSELAAEVTGALQDIVVELRLDGRDVRVAVNRPAHDASADDTNGGFDPAGHDRSGAGSGDRRAFSFSKRGRDWPSGAADSAGEAGPSADDLRRAMQDAGGELSRTTVRLFNELKAQAEQAASEQGVSLNTYISRAVSESVRSAVPSKGSHHGRGHSGPGGRNVTGYIKG